AVVVPIDEVDVGMTRRSPEHFIASRATCEGMGGRIAIAEIGLHLNDPAHNLLLANFANQEFSKQIARNPPRITVIEGSRQDVDSNHASFLPACKLPRFRHGAQFHAASFRYSSTSSACPSGFTLWKTCWILPSGPMMNVVRATPITFLPYMFFSFITPKASAVFLSASASKVKGRLNLSWNFFCALGVSGDMPSSTAPVFCIFLYESRNSQASMVHPGVSARG